MANFYINKTIIIDKNEMCEVKMMPEKIYNQLSEEEKSEWVFYTPDMDLSLYVKKINER
jgi:hypothetical protein